MSKQVWKVVEMGTGVDGYVHVSLVVVDIAAISLNWPVNLKTKMNPREVG